MKVYIQVEKSLPIEVPFTIHTTPVWKAVLWNTYSKSLPFMADTDPDYPSIPYTIGDLMINYEVYKNTNGDLTTVQNEERTCCLIDNTLYVHFAEHYPPAISPLNMSARFGKLSAFSSEDPEVIGDAQYVPDVISVPELKEETDTWNYSKMKFLSGNVELLNTNSEYDALMEQYGNNLNILRNDGGTMTLIWQFYVAAYSLTAKSIVFKCKDKRERITFDAPNKYYTTDEFPFIDEKYVDKLITDAYGYVRNVPAVCLERNWIYENHNDQSAGWHNWYKFKVASHITRVIKIERKIDDETWDELFPGLGIPPGEMDIDESFYVSDNSDNVRYNGMTIGGSGFLPEDNDGTIELAWNQAIKPVTGNLDTRDGDAYEIRVTGIFVDKNNPRDIIVDLLERYGLYSYADAYFSTVEWERELSPLANYPIGLYMKTKKSLYEWIEQLQNSSVLGFQVLPYENVLTARLDNPNRAITFPIITESEIVNILSVSVEFDGENYASIADVGYDYDATEDEYKRVVNNSQNNTTKDKYVYEKTYENDSCLNNVDDAQLKTRAVLEDLTTVHPIIKGLRLIGQQYFSIRLMDILTVQLTLPLPRQLRRLQPYMTDRNFMGEIRVQVVGRTVNLKTEEVTLDLRERPYSNVVDEILAGSDEDTLYEIEGLMSGTLDTEYDTDIDGLMSTASDNDYDTELDGGN